MNKWLLILSICCLALTPAEKKAIQQAKDYVDKAKQENIEAWGEAKQAWDKAYDAEQHAKNTDVEITKTKKQIEEAHKNEQRLGDENAKMKPVYDQVNKYWGIGGIIYGFQRLAKHLLILLAVLVGLALIIWVVSLFVPWLKPLIGIFNNILTSILNFIKNLFKKK